VDDEWRFCHLTSSTDVFASALSITDFKTQLSGVMSRSTSTYHGDDRSDQHTEHPEKASDSPTESHEHTFQDKDVERAASHEEPTDPNLVDWDTDDPENPLNWPTKKTWCNLGIVSFLRFLTPLASSMIAPVVSLVLRDLHTGNKTIGSLVVSIYILGYAIGPMVIAPLSEIYGRLPVYHVNNVLFFVWNLASALAPNIGALLAFRLLAGLAGSCPVAIGSGSVADCVPKEKRGMAMAIMTAGPLMGTSLQRFINPSTSANFVIHRSRPGSNRRRLSG
jgi:hypothetical protein